LRKQQFVPKFIHNIILTTSNQDQNKNLCLSITREGSHSNLKKGKKNKEKNRPATCKTNETKISLAGRKKRGGFGYQCRENGGAHRRTAQGRRRRWATGSGVFFLFFLSPCEKIEPASG